jgi:hypothetical protein
LDVDLPECETNVDQSTSSLEFNENIDSNQSLMRKYSLRNNNHKDNKLPSTRANRRKSELFISSSVSKKNVDQSTMQGESTKKYSQTKEQINSVSITSDRSSDQSDFSSDSENFATKRKDSLALEDKSNGMNRRRQSLLHIDSVKYQQDLKEISKSTKRSSIKGLSVASLRKGGAAAPNSTALPAFFPYSSKDMINDVIFRNIDSDGDDQIVTDQKIKKLPSPIHRSIRLDRKIPQELEESMLLLESDSDEELGYVPDTEVPDALGFPAAQSTDEAYFPNNQTLLVNLGSFENLPIQSLESISAKPKKKRRKGKIKKKTIKNETNTPSLNEDRVERMAIITEEVSAEALPAAFITPVAKMKKEMISTGEKVSKRIMAAQGLLDKNYKNISLTSKPGKQESKIADNGKRTDYFDQRDRTRNDSTIEIPASRKQPSLQTNILTLNNSYLEHHKHIVQVEPIIEELKKYGIFDAHKDKETVNNFLIIDFNVG